MNRTISFITKMMFAAVTVIMAACSSDDNATQALTVQVKVSMPEGFKSDILYTGHTVTMGKYTAITNDTVQTYFDTEVGEFRCYKKANLLKIA